MPIRWCCLALVLFLAPAYAQIDSAKLDSLRTAIAKDHRRMREKQETALQRMDSSQGTRGEKNVMTGNEDMIPAAIPWGLILSAGILVLILLFAGRMLWWKSGP